jgi:eukaryotic-like serine/threonine-protein kinase
MTALPPPVVETLRDRYVIEREIGHGGMATVYLAHDVRQGQPVAIKIMRRDLSATLDAERFRREMGIAASLSHPGIVPLFESGNAGGVLYYAMPYIEGGSLYQRLEREHPLALDDALRITHEVADALGYAHGFGILHRDVKPENILLGKTRALVGDFGLARAIGLANYRKLTDTGIMVGTLDYTSPEQLLGDRDLDQRADIYSLGCLLYEMLTGAPPYAGRVAHQLVTRIFRAPVPSARRLRATVPETVDEALGRALAKSAGERFRSMAEFAAALPLPG